MEDRQLDASVMARTLRNYPPFPFRTQTEFRLIWCARQGRIKVDLS